ncbi:MAG: CRISPR system precrRNA processing endoribonuclease RAMP protein Cas6 [bacterium]|nr:CRISPR system precrRNA processing endoribonuclease RAMP protein Cas6 [bacterium]
MLERFRVARYEVAFAPVETLSLPAFMGSTLRGGLGNAFRRIACADPIRVRSRNCEGCLLQSNCPYAYVFETTPPPGTERLRTHADIPRPFVLEPPEQPQTLYPPGKPLHFGLVLVGRAIDYLPYFVVTFRELGTAGLGKGRARFELAAVRSWLEGCEVALYSAGEERITPLAVAVTGEEFRRRAAELAGPRLALHFLTMTRLQFGGELAERPDFHVVVRALLRRVANLAYFHHGWSLECDFRGLLAAAESVSLVTDETRWMDWTRYSSRQDTRMRLGGIVGRAVYAGDFEPFLPLLVLGTYVHVGKNATFGLGRFRAERP